MATAYTTSAQMTIFLGANRLLMLQDRNADGSADTDVLTQAIDEAGTLIDARLARRYTVPFAAITDTPDTPDLVQMIARHLTAHLLYKALEPAGDDQAYYWRQADALMNDILAGRTTIPGGTEADSEDRLRSVTVASASPVLAGYTDDDITSGTRRTYGL